MNSQIFAGDDGQLRAQYGLDQPLPVRYWQWLKSSARGEFGYSFAYNTPASTLLWPRARNTLLLSVPALLISWLIAVPLGVLAAGWKGRWADRLFSGGTSALLALPDVLIALAGFAGCVQDRNVSCGRNDVHECPGPGNVGVAA